MKEPRIAIIDDDAWMAGQMTLQLEKANFSVDYAADGIAGMQLIDQLHPAAIILDIFLPGPNGIVLLHELRSHSDLAQIPVIVCTTSAADIPKGSLDVYGVRAVLDKTTMEPGDIIAAVRGVLL